MLSRANVLLRGEPTNKKDPASRKEIPRPRETFSNAVVLVSHDVGAVTAMNPEGVLILPDTDEDHWNEGCEELISLSRFRGSLIRGMLHYARSCVHIVFFLF